jgi:hypothetical protein
VEQISRVRGSREHTEQGPFPVANEGKQKKTEGQDSSGFHRVFLSA